MGAQSLRVDDDKYGNPSTRHLGDRIEAKCLGWDRYYPGKITKINLDGTYDIAFEDGETRKSVNEDCMIESFDAEEDDEDDSRNCNRNGRTQENPTCSFCRNKEATTKLKNVTNNKWEPTCYDCAHAIEIKVAVQKVRNIKLVSLSPHQVANQALSSHLMKTSRKRRRKKRPSPPPEQYDENNYEKHKKENREQETKCEQKDNYDHVKQKTKMKQKLRQEEKIKCSNIAQLKDMGFSHNLSRRAVNRYGSVGAAADWIMDQAQEEDEDQEDFGSAESVPFVRRNNFESKIEDSSDEDQDQDEHQDQDQDWDFLNNDFTRPEINHRNNRSEYVNARFAVRDGVNAKVVQRIVLSSEMTVTPKVKHCMGGYLYIQDTEQTIPPEICGKSFGFFGKTKMSCSICNLKFCNECCCQSLTKRLPPWLSNINKPNVCNACNKAFVNQGFKDFNLKSAKDLLILRNEALEYNQGGIQRMVYSKRVMKRKYREELDHVISKGEFLNEDQVLKFLNKYKGNIRKTEAKLRKHASYIIKKKNKSWLQKQI